MPFVHSLEGVMSPIAAIVFYQAVGWLAVLTMFLSRDNNAVFVASFVGAVTVFTIGIVLSLRVIFGLVSP